MKHLTLLLLTLLGMIPVTDAQTVPAPGASKAVSANETNADGSVNLPGGKLGEMVAEIERRLPGWPRKKDGAAWVWPNIVYAPAVMNRDALPLRMRGVEPVEALALLAAAAGCKLEPIFAPKETPEAVGQRVVGYRFEMDATATAARIGAAPGSAPQDLRPTVRVYSLGAILSGSKEDVASKAERVRQLVELAIQKTEPASNRTAPELAFHAESRTLIAKATAAQHELLQQVI